MSMARVGVVIVVLCLFQGCVQVPVDNWRSSVVYQAPGHENTPQTLSFHAVPGTMLSPQVHPMGVVWQAYRQFNYQQVIERASNIIANTPSSRERGMAYMLRGASRYLLNDLDEAKSDFTAAKKAGVISLEAKIFPADMIEVFNTSK